jgi:hypothetical protein
MTRPSSVEELFCSVFTPSSKYYDNELFNKIVTSYEYYLM